MQNFTNQKTVTILRILYALWVIIGVFSIVYIPSTLIEPDNIQATLANISEQQVLFKIGVVGRIIVQLLFILIPLLLYKLLKHVDKDQAVLMVVFALVSVPIAIYNEANMMAILSFVDQPEMVSNYIDLYKYALIIAMIFWGLWLFPLGRLVYKSVYFPNILGVFLYVAGGGYLLSVLIDIFMPEADTLYMIAEILTITEVLFVIWFVAKGVKQKAS